MKKFLVPLLLLFALSLHADIQGTASAVWDSTYAVDSPLTLLASRFPGALITFSGTGTFTTGQIIFEASDDYGVHYYPLSAVRNDSGLFDTRFTLAAVNRSWRVQLNGFNFLRVRLNPAITGNGVAVVNIEGTSFINFSRTPEKLTYSASTTAKTATTAGTAPFFTICGSASRTIKIQNLVIGGTVATAAIYGDIQLRATSTATSAGTAVALIRVPYDSTSAPATATVNFYTVLATGGTLIGNVASRTVYFPITGTVTVSPADIQFNNLDRSESQSVTLTGTAQCLEAGFGTTPTNAPTLTTQVVWTEE